MLGSTAALCSCLLSLSVLYASKVLHVGDSGDGRLGIMYTSATATPAQAAAAAASNGGAPRIEKASGAPAMLLADALVLAAGGFAASKQMLQVSNV